MTNRVRIDYVGYHLHGRILPVFGRQTSEDRAGLDLGRQVLVMSNGNLYALAAENCIPVEGDST